MVSLTINSSKDAIVDEEFPDATHGTDNDIYVGIDNNTANQARRIFIEFDISSMIDVPIDNISSATLNMYQTAPPISPNRTIDFQMIDNNTWGETTITWNNKPTSTDYNIEDNTWTSHDIWYDISIRSIVKAALRAGNTVVGIMMKYTDESIDGSHRVNSLYSRNQGSPHIPYLQIEYDTYSQTALHGSLCKNLLFKDGFGEITMTDHNCPSPCDAATFTFKTAWGTTYTTVLLDVGDTQQYDNGIMHHSFKLYFMSASSAPCDNLAAATIEEKYWEDNCYVKTTGDNDRNGTSWTEAWETITHAANEVFDGQEVHIGFGTYSSETDVTPDNAGSTGIKYTPETAGTGGGTGSVTVNM